MVTKKSPNDKSVEISGVEFGGSKIPVFMENMVESKSLIFEVAQNVKEISADFMRGGAFKPLTFPYRSEKYNETRLEGLNGLKKLRRI